MSYNSVGQRIKEFVKLKRIKQHELGDILDLSRGSVNSALLDKSNFTVPTIVRLLEHFPELSARWLMTGKGMMMNDGTSPEIRESQESQALERRIEDLEKTIHSQSMTIEAKDEIIKLLKKDS